MNDTVEEEEEEMKDVNCVWYVGSVTSSYEYESPFEDVGCCRAAVILNREAGGGGWSE